MASAFCYMPSRSAGNVSVVLGADLLAQFVVWHKMIVSRRRPRPYIAYSIYVGCCAREREPRNLSIRARGCLSNLNMLHSQCRIYINGFLPSVTSGYIYICTKRSYKVMAMVK